MWLGATCRFGLEPHAPLSGKARMACVDDKLMNLDANWLSAMHCLREWSGVCLSRSACMLDAEPHAALTRMACVR